MPESGDINIAFRSRGKRTAKQTMFLIYEQYVNQTVSTTPGRCIADKPND